MIMYKPLRSVTVGVFYYLTDNLVYAHDFYKMGRIDMTLSTVPSSSLSVGLIIAKSVL